MDATKVNQIRSGLAAASLGALLAVAVFGAASAHEASSALSPPPFASPAVQAPGARLAQADVSYAQVVLNCMVAEQGAVKDCQVVSEDPAGSGYGAAALQMTSQFHLPLKADGGVAVPGARLNIPIRIRVTK